MRKRITSCGLVVAFLSSLSIAALAQDKPKSEQPAPAKEKAKSETKPDGKSDGALPTEDEFLERAVDALGGKAAFSKLKSRVSKGRYEIVGQGASGPMTTYQQAPDKQYVVIEMEGMGKVEQGASGAVAWSMSSMMGPQIMTGDERAQALREAAFDLPLRFKDFYKKIEVLGTEKIDDTPVYKVEMIPVEGKPEINYYDQKTMLPKRTELRVVGPMGEMAVTVDYADYRKVDGIMIPMKVSQNIGDLQKVLITLADIEHNVDIPAEKFEPPAAVRELLDKQQKSEGKAEKGKPDDKKP